MSCYVLWGIKNGLKTIDIYQFLAKQSSANLAIPGPLIRVTNDFTE